MALGTAVLKVYGFGLVRVGFLYPFSSSQEAGVHHLPSRGRRPGRVPVVPLTFQCSVSQSTGRVSGRCSCQKHIV